MVGDYRRHPVKQSRGESMAASAIPRLGTPGGATCSSSADGCRYACTVIYNKQSRGCMTVKHDRTVPRTHVCTYVGQV
jgi:hypothetical protein